MAQQAPLTARRWTRAEYERLVELGLFEREPLELVGGQLIVAEPQSAYHASSVGRVEYALRAALPPGWIVRTQAPVSLDDDSEPEPDLAVVPGSPGDYRDAHPTQPALVIEVAESSLHFDRRDKASLYARAGVKDYWIVNLVRRQLEVHRDPAPDASAPYGWRYRSVVQMTPPAVVELVGVSGVRITVAALLP
jgi:Uma2 family endonuclease